jgi:thioredoxin reductase (NADPH)
MFDYEIGILGIGPAGIQAGLHSGRRKRKIVVFGKPEESALYKAHIENYFGLKEKTEGKVLIELGLKQLERYGVKVIKEDIVKIEPLDQGFKLITEKEKEIKVIALILAMGVKRKRKLFKDEEKFLGKGLSYCIDCDAWFYKGKKVVVIGEGSSAYYGAKLLSKLASEVYFCHLNRDVDLEEEFRGYNIKFMKNRPVELVGDVEVKGVKCENGDVLYIDGVFIELGAKGPLELLAPLGIELDPENFSYVKVDHQMKTNVEGIFACGDLTGPPLQLAKAVGEGCIAGISASEYVERFLKKCEEEKSGLKDS